MEKWINNRVVYSGNIFSVREGEIETGKGQVYPRQVVVHPGGVGIVALQDGQVILVKQFRIPIERRILELPAGRLEAGESPEMCARRELVEEVGYIADKFELIAEYYTSVGYSTEKMYLYLVADARKTAAEPEADEELEIIYLSLAEVKHMLDKGEFEDSKTIIGLREMLIRLSP